MIANVFLNRSKEYLIAKNFIDYHREIELINYIKQFSKVGISIKPKTDIEKINK